MLHQIPRATFLMPNDRGWCSVLLQQAKRVFISFLLLHIVVIEMLLLGYGEGDRANREDREDRDAYRRGGAADADGMCVLGFGCKCDNLVCSW